MLRYIVIFSTLCLLAACGPRDIGQGASAESGLIPEAAAADMLRAPITGMNNTQRMLYWYNRPDVMANMQSWRVKQYRRRMGLAPEPENPEYRAIPRQRSPFRQ